jgi:hypothetical protein
LRSGGPFPLFCKIGDNDIHRHNNSFDDDSRACDNPLGERMRFGIVVGKNHPLAGRKSIGFAELRGENIMAPVNDNVYPVAMLMEIEDAEIFNNVYLIVNKQTFVNNPHCHSLPGRVYLKEGE